MTGHRTSGEITRLLSGAADRLRIDVRGDREAFVQRLAEAGFEAEPSEAGVRVNRRPGVEAAAFQAARALGAEVRYMGAEIRSLEELFLELVERSGAGRS